MSSCRRRDRRRIIDRPERSTVVACADDLEARILQTVRSRFIAVPGRLLAAAVCALVGHVALYQSVLPADEVHSYLSWYEPVVAGLSVAAVLGLAGLVAFGLLRPDFRLPRLSAGRPFDQSATRLAMSGLAFLLVQESIEQSVATHSASIASIADGRWLAVLVVVTVSAAALAFLARLGERAVRALLAQRQPQPARALVAPSWPRALAELRRSRPLARHAALRAPPAPSPA